MWQTVLDLALDRSIYFSFDRSGFERHARAFRAAEVSVDGRGKVFLVTGANSGIGFAIAEGLARRGAAVWLLCRDGLRGRRALRELRRRTGNDALRLARLDVSDLRSVRSFAARFPDIAIDGLIHNAGILADARRLTADGIESTLATNVVGPFLLTRLLWPHLAAAADARVVWVSSGGMYASRLALADADWTARPFDGVAAYAQTKRMQVVLAAQFAARAEGTRIGVHSMHPGWVDTAAVRTALPRFHRWMAGRLRTPEQGADTVLWLALSDRLETPGGRFWFDRTPQSTHLLPLTRESGAERDALWAFCASRAGLPTAPCAARAERRSA